MRSCMKIEEAKRQLSSLDRDNKYETMIKTASIITKMLEKHNIKPIIVGGLSVEIYTQDDYSTRNIDFVSDGFSIIEELLLSLDFLKDGRHFYRKDIEIAIEIPDNFLEGDMNKVVKVNTEDGLYVYLISLEDIIIDRLRATIHWKSEEDAIWGFKLLVNNFDSVDTLYIESRLEVEQEKEEFKNWLEQITKN